MGNHAYGPKDHHGKDHHMFTIELTSRFYSRPKYLTVDRCGCAGYIGPKKYRRLFTTREEAEKVVARSHWSGDWSPSVVEA